VQPGSPLGMDLRRVAEVFGDLQQARHDADYNLRKLFTRNMVQTYITDVTTAQQSWQRIRRSDDAKLFLTSLLLWKLWKR
jgi:hypothetical protein